MGELLLRVDPDACERIASLLRGSSIPRPREDTPHEGLNSEELGNFYLMLVAICHQTQTLEGVIDGVHFRGWDFLARKLAKATSSSKELLEPSTWEEFTVPQLTSLFRDQSFGETLSGPADRTELLRDLGTVMRGRGWRRFDELYQLSERRAVSGSPNLATLLSSFRAYSDPVRKKTLFLLGIMATSGDWAYVDGFSLGAPVDYHEVRGHLRLGTVVVTDSALRSKLLDHADVQEPEDVAIRQAVYDALGRIASSLAISPLQLHYLLWHIFRSICLRTEPLCWDMPDSVIIPEAYRDVIEQLAEARQCPFAAECASSNASPRYFEHRFDTLWY